MGERSGSSANWMLQPPSMPSARMMRSDALRSIWYSLSVSVCDGATTIESPVCTPIGSRFSMLHTVMHVSAPSRITSYSISFHPVSDRSTRTWPIGDEAIPRAGLRESDREVEPGLPAERREQAARALPRDDALEHLDGERLEVGDVRDARVGHDRGRVRVHEYGLDALLAQGAAGLGTRVVEFGRLPDEDRPRPDDQDLHTSSHPPPTATQRPPTRTAVTRPFALSTSMSRMLGRPISNPCSLRIRAVGVPSTRPCAIRYAPRGPCAEPVAGSSPTPMPAPNMRPCSCDPERSALIAKT